MQKVEDRVAIAENNVQTCTEKLNDAQRTLGNLTVVGGGTMTERTVLEVKRDMVTNPQLAEALDLRCKNLTATRATERMADNAEVKARFEVTSLRLEALSFDVGWLIDRVQNLEIASCRLTSGIASSLALQVTQAQEIAVNLQNNVYAPIETSILRHQPQPGPSYALTCLGGVAGHPVSNDYQMLRGSWVPPQVRDPVVMTAPAVMQSLPGPLGATAVIPPTYVGTGGHAPPLARQLAGGLGAASVRGGGGSAHVGGVGATLGGAPSSKHGGMGAGVLVPSAPPPPPPPLPPNAMNRVGLPGPSILPLGACAPPSAPPSARGGSGVASPAGGGVPVGLLGNPYMRA